MSGNLNSNNFEKDDCNMKTEDCDYKDLIDKLKEIEGLKLSIPQGAFYIFPDVSSYFGKSYKNNKFFN